jgi:protein involved in polysaccharide export with SLBB domain
MAGSLSTGLAALLFGLAATACAGHRVEHPTSFEIYLAEPPTEPPRYELQVGDELEVRFLHAPEQNVLLVVRPDGFVSVPLANELRAAGRTPEELRVEITSAWRSELRDPEVAVVLKRASSWKIHVGGAVSRPGLFELGGERTVLQALFEAGGFLPTADLEQVLVIRPEGPGRFAVIPLDLTAVLEARDTRQNLLLRPRDAIFVPTSAIADVNVWVDQYIRKNIPISFGWSLDIGGG